MKRMKLWLALALPFTIVMLYFIPVPLANMSTYAEGPSDPAPEILPVGTPNGKTILFDNTHEQTAGSADWVIDGAFSDFGNALANNGYDVKELRKSAPLTYSDIQNADVFVIPEANVPFKTSEQDALLQYVQNGGSLMFIGDHYNSDRNLNRWDAGEVFNGYRRGAYQNPTLGMSTQEAESTAMQNVTSTDWLANNFGIRFRYNAIGDVTANQIVEPSQAFNITSGVQTVAMHAGSTLAIIDPHHAKGIVYLPNLDSSQSWPYAVDQGVYDGGGIPEGPMVAVAKKGAGKAAFIGDSSVVEDNSPKYKREDTGATKTTYNGFEEQDDGTLLINLVNWLANQESYTSFDQVSGLQLDQPTQLLNMEIPENSTEPESEPWSTPTSGYNWFDPSTFAPGSYGYDTDGSGSGGTGGSGGNGSTALFFSEYDEGSSYNKALEIYNGTGSAVDLSTYTIQLSNVSQGIPLNGTLENGQVYVIANPNASSTILSAADAVDSRIQFNGDDSCTLQHNGTTIDVIGQAGTTFGENVTLVRHGTITGGSTTYDANQWDTYPENTWTDLGEFDAQSVPAIVMSEDFENATKQAYASGTVQLSTGIWYFDNALIGNLSSDQKNGSQAARIRADGSISMNFDVNEASEVRFSHANFGSDTGAQWKLQQSTDGGSVWTDVSGWNSSGSNLQQASFSINTTGSIRFRILVSGLSGDRINIDDLQILD